MKIYRYRQCFADGPSEWEYTDTYTGESLEEMLREEYSWADHYRGCDIEIVDADIDFIKSKIEDAKESITYYQKYINRLESELSKIV